MLFFLFEQLGNWFVKKKMAIACSLYIGSIRCIKENEFKIKFYTLHIFWLKLIGATGREIHGFVVLHWRKLLIFITNSIFFSVQLQIRISRFLLLCMSKSGPQRFGKGLMTPPPLSTVKDIVVSFTVWGHRQNFRP